MYNIQIPQNRLLYNLFYNYRQLKNNEYNEFCFKVARFKIYYKIVYVVYGIILIITTEYFFSAII